MQAYVFASQASANACAPIVDASQGYPKPGVNVGGGLHVVPPFVTTTYAQSRKHPTRAQWAYPADSITTPALSAHASALSLPAPTTLDATWTPAPTTLGVHRP